MELTLKQQANLLEFWQTSQIDSNLREFYAIVDISVMKNDKLINAVKSVLTYDLGKYIAFTSTDFETLLNKIRSIN